MVGAARKHIPLPPPGQGDQVLASDCRPRCPRNPLQALSLHMSTLRLRTAAWYGDFPVDIMVPDSWQLTVCGAQTGPALTDAQIIERFEAPAAQSPIRELARGMTRQVIMVDDLNRPMPA